MTNNENINAARGEAEDIISFSAGGLDLLLTSDKKMEVAAEVMAHLDEMERRITALTNEGIDIANFEKAGILKSAISSARSVTVNICSGLF